MTERVTHGNPQGSAEAESVHSALRSQGILIGRHESMLEALGNQQGVTNQRLGEIANLLSNLTQVLTPQTVSPPPLLVAGAPAAGAVFPQNVRELSVPPSEIFEGDSDRCSGFLLQCSLNFRRNPLSFHSDQSKIIYIIQSLKGRALKWAESYLSDHSIDLLTLESFVTEFRRVFDFPLRKEEAARKLQRMRLGNKLVSEHAIDFRVTAADSGWNEEALKSAFLNSLSDQLQDQIATRDEPGSLDDLVNLAIRLDNRLKDRAKARNFKSRSLVADRPGPSTFTSPNCFQVTPEFPSGEEPMQIDNTKLSPAERQRRQRFNLCMFCGQPGHFVKTCTKRLNSRSHQ